MNWGCVQTDTGITQAPARSLTALPSPGTLLAGCCKRSTLPAPETPRVTTQPGHAALSSSMRDGIQAGQCHLQISADTQLHHTNMNSISKPKENRVISKHKSPSKPEEKLCTPTCTPGISGVSTPLCFASGQNTHRARRALL